MAIARKALVWGLFAAGGTITAMLFPVLVLLFVLVSAGYTPGSLEFENLREALRHGLVAAGFFVVLVLAAWHAAHRLRIFLHDLGVRADQWVALLAYVLAGAFTTVLAAVLWKLL